MMADQHRLGQNNSVLLVNTRITPVRISQPTSAWSDSDLLAGNHELCFLPNDRSDMNELPLPMLING